MLPGSVFFCPRPVPGLLGWGYPEQLGLSSTACGLVLGDSIRPCINGVSLLHRIASVAPLKKPQTIYQPGLRSWSRSRSILSDSDSWSFYQISCLHTGCGHSIPIVEARATKILYRIFLCLKYLVHRSFCYDIIHFFCNIVCFQKIIKNIVVLS